MESTLSGRFCCCSSARYLGTFRAVYLLLSGLYICICVAFIRTVSLFVFTHLLFVCSFPGRLFVVLSYPRIGWPFFSMLFSSSLFALVSPGRLAIVLRLQLIMCSFIPAYDMQPQWSLQCCSRYDGRDAGSIFAGLESQLLLCLGDLFVFCLPSDDERQKRESWKESERFRIRLCFEMSKPSLLPLSLAR